MIEPGGSHLKHFRTGGLPFNCRLDGTDPILADRGATDTTSGKAAVADALQRAEAGRLGQHVSRGTLNDEETR